MTTPPAPTAPGPIASTFELEETWIYYDGPLIFTALRAGRRYLVTMVDVLEHPDLPPHAVTRGNGAVDHIPVRSLVMLAAPLSDAQAAALADGALRPRAFWEEQSIADCWILTDGPTYTERPFDQDRIPEDWLPTPDASYLALMGERPSCAGPGRSPAEVLAAGQDG